MTACVLSDNLDPHEEKKNSIVTTKVLQIVTMPNETKLDANIKDQYLAGKFDHFDGEVDFDGKIKDEPPESKKETPYDDEVEDEKDKLASLAEFNKKKADFRHKDKDTTIINFYTKVVFPSNEAKEEFYKKANIPANEEFITFDQLKRYFEKKQVS